jgi:uncharacterized protein YebE (UPF0316 family)
MSLESIPWLLIAILIFFARILDVGLGTMRIIFISRGFKYLATTVSFFEILIWLFAITQIMKNLNNYAYYVAFAGGFASGTFVGIWIENKLAMGVAIIRIITQNNTSSLIKRLKDERCGLTVIQGQGLFNPVEIIFMIAKRNRIKGILGIVKELNPDAVYTIEDVRSVNPAILPSLQPVFKKHERKFLKYVRKGK